MNTALPSSLSRRALLTGAIAVLALGGVAVSVGTMPARDLMAEFRALLLRMNERQQALVLAHLEKLAAGQDPDSDEFRRQLRQAA